MTRKLRLSSMCIRRWDSGERAIRNDSLGMTRFKGGRKERGKGGGPVLRSEISRGLAPKGDQTKLIAARKELPREKSISSPRDT